MKERIDEIIKKTKGVKTGSKMIFDGGFIKVFEEGYTLPHGRNNVKQRIQKNNGKDAVVIITRTSDDKYIMVFQNRVDNIVSCEFPSGYVEKDESYETAARRELLEETGYKANDLIEVCSFNQDEGCSASLNKGFIARDCVKVDDQNLDESEYIKYFECTLDELFYLVNNGYIKGANSLLTIEKAKNYLKKRG